MRDAILDLLTIEYEEGHVILSFAGMRDVRLSAELLDCKLDDFGEPWPTKSCPDHAPEAAWAEWEK